LSGAGYIGAARQTEYSGDFSTGQRPLVLASSYENWRLLQISLHFFNSQPAETGLSHQISQQLEDFIAGEPFLVSREEAAGRAPFCLL
jgi:hypothetical protein